MPDDQPRADEPAPRERDHAATPDEDRPAETSPTPTTEDERPTGPMPKEMPMNLPPAYAVMYDELCEQHGEERVVATLQEGFRSHLRRLYDNREQLHASGDAPNGPPGR